MAQYNLQINGRSYEADVDADAEGSEPPAETAEEPPAKE